jgi:hypothetical protein
MQTRIRIQKGKKNTHKKEKFKEISGYEMLER